MPQNRSHIPIEIQRQVFIAAGHRCSVCGAELPLERAHIIAWRRSKDHSAENLICLCANCHGRADTEGWGEETLRQYKEKPWVIRARLEEAIASDSRHQPSNTQKQTEKRKITYFASLSLGVFLGGLLLIWLLLDLRVLPGLQNSSSLLIRPSPLGLGAMGDGVASLHVQVRTKAGRIHNFSSKPCPGPRCPRSSYLLGRTRPDFSRLRGDWELELAGLHYPEGTPKYKSILVEWKNFQILYPEFDLAPGMEIRIELKNSREILACKELIATDDFIDVLLIEDSKCDSPSTRWHS